MMNPELVFRRPIFIVLLCLSSCRTAPQTAETPKPPIKVSPAQERYKKTVEDQLGPIWYRLINSNVDSMSVGTVKTIFEIPAAGGKVRNLRVISNTGGRMDELVARGAIDRLRAPPIPPDVLAQLQHSNFFLEESFTVYEGGDRPSPTPAKKR